MCETLFPVIIVHFSVVIQSESYTHYVIYYIFQGKVTIELGT